MIQIAEFAIAQILFCLAAVAFLAQIYHLEVPRKRGLVRVIKGLLALVLLVVFALSTAVNVKIKGVKAWSNLWAVDQPAPVVESRPAPVPRPIPQSGLLVPANDTVPHNPCTGVEIPPGGLLVLFGGHAAIAKAGTTTILRLEGEDVLSVGRIPGGMSLDTIIRDVEGSEVARITKNVIRLAPDSAYRVERPDPHTVAVIAPDDSQILYVRYMNPTTMSFAGTFFRKGRPPFSLEDAVMHGYTTITRSCFEAGRVVINIKK
jgi:hypothetical protein